jgi:integrase
LRISDAIIFRPGKLVLDSEIAEYTYLPIKTARTRKLCTTFMPLWLAEKLKGLSHLSPVYPFFDGKDREVLIRGARRELAIAGTKARVPDAHPHRFRDSFAVNALNNNTPIEAVQKMLAHSSVGVTEHFYAPWVRSRRDQLRRAYLKSHQPESSRVAPISKVG